VRAAAGVLGRGDGESAQGYRAAALEEPFAIALDRHELVGVVSGGGSTNAGGRLEEGALGVLRGAEHHHLM
jgi:hypothetical protein